MPLPTGPRLNSLMPGNSFRTYRRRILRCSSSIRILRTGSHRVPLLHRSLPLILSNRGNVGILQNSNYFVFPALGDCLIFVSQLCLVCDTAAVILCAIAIPTRDSADVISWLREIAWRCTPESR